jgi:hypothetical protein
MESCLGFDIPCGTLTKGTLAVAMAFVLFVGSVYIMLSAVFGRRMGYLVLMVTFSGWMILLSGLWLSGYFISQGLDTKVNLGPRGSEPAWVVAGGGLQASSERFPEAEEYPGGEWTEPGEALDASIQSVTAAVQTFMAEEANAERGVAEGELGALTTAEFSVQNIRFATASDDKTSLAAAQSFFNGGGPLVTVVLFHDSGSVPRYSYMFLAGSILLFALHVPLLDRAEKKRKGILTGGGAPPWYGPA